MHLYLVERTDDWTYGDFDDMVVVAKDEESARQIHPREGEPLWPGETREVLWRSRFSSWVKSPDLVHVTLLGTSIEQEERVVLASFNAG